MAAATFTRKRQLGYTLKRRIAALDPERDHEEVARLTLEVLYGDPIAVHAAYLIGFSRQVAVPGIARVIYRGGAGANLRDVARRTDDTLALFGAFLKWGPSSPQGWAAIGRMEGIHDRFPIVDEQKRYTLATLIFEPDRTSLPRERPRAEWATRLVFVAQTRPKSRESAGIGIRNGSI